MGARMLNASFLFRSDGVEIADVACRHGRGRGQSVEEARWHAIVFVRRGCFVRSAGGTETLLDPTVAYCTNPGDEQRFDHPHEHGDDCTAVFLSPELIASLWGGDPTLPSAPIPTSPYVDLEHRLLLRAARRGTDAGELQELAVTLAAQALEQADPRRVASGRPATARARRAVVDGAREILATNPEHSLDELARALAVSRHHLSRVFHSATGHTISRHRMRLRVRAGLERLAEGEHDLARMAADLGFADQSHLCRVVREELGSTPSALREVLA
jgi:AraC-like DNA-binding protein